MVKEVVEKTVDIAQDLLVLVFTSLLMIVLGLLYFLITLWIVNTGAGLLGVYPSGDFLVLTAGLLAAASMVGARRR